MKQLTKEQAIALAESGEWKDWTLEEIGKFQLYQDKLCVPFDKYHEAIEHLLGRPVWTHEFAWSDSLKAEYEKKKPPPTFREIMELIPEEKRIVIGL